MNRLVSLALLLAPILPVRATHSQTITIPAARCPRDSVATTVQGGITFEGIPARAYVQGFVSGDPNALSRTSTGTSGVDASMIAILQDALEADRNACSKLNHFLSNGESGLPSRPWVYFRAGNLYFASPWTRPDVLGTGFRTGYGTVMVFDANLELTGVWTA